MKNEIETKIMKSHNERLNDSIMFLIGYLLIAIVSAIFLILLGVIIEIKNEVKADNDNGLYIKELKVVELYSDSDDVLLIDNEGYLWGYIADDLQINDKLVVIMYNNDTDKIEDDIIVSVVKSE